MAATPKTESIISISSQNFDPRAKFFLPRGKEIGDRDLLSIVVARRGAKNRKNHNQFDQSSVKIHLNPLTSSLSLSLSHTHTHTQHTHTHTFSMFV